MQLITHLPRDALKNRVIVTTESRIKYKKPEMGRIITVYENVPFINTALNTMAVG